MHTELLRGGMSAENVGGITWSPLIRKPVKLRSNFPYLPPPFTPISFTHVLLHELAQKSQVSRVR